MSILNVNKINPVGGGSTITIAGIASVTSSVTAPSFVGAVTGNVTGNVTGTSSGLSGNPSINTTGIITATTLSYTGNQNLSHRNLIINGDMRIAQRATSSTTSGYGSLDRFKHEYAGTDENPTFAQVSLTTSDTPYTLGLTKAAKITNGNQTSGLQASSLINFNQQIEAQNIRNSGWNYTSSSSYITLSFWVRASVEQNYHGFVKTADGTNYVYPYETGTLSANTWTKITKSIPGNSNLTINDDTGNGFQVFPIFFGGTSYTSNSVTNNAWATWSSGGRSKDQTATWFTTNDSTLEITGVQLEVGPVATPFEHEPEYVTFTKCQRYFQYWYNAVRFPSTSSVNHATYHFPTPMRAAPTVVRTGDQAGSYESGSTTALMVGNSQYKYYYSGLLSYGNSSDKGVGGYGTLDAEI